MKKKILVAGAGHGGLAAAAYLAEQGYETHVFEKKKREDLGYDWLDTIGRDTFDCAGIRDYDGRDVSLRLNSTFYAPSLKTPVSFDADPGSEAFEIERKVLYDYLIRNAEGKGVKLYYSVTVGGPALDENNNVAGLIVDGETIPADLVIDSAGLYSPVIAGLPAAYRMNDSFSERDVFHTYRAYFNLSEGIKTKNMERFNIFFRFYGIKGIAWFKISEGKADVLAGSVEALDAEKVDTVLKELRKVQPAIGYELLRGGQIADIPIKSTHTLLIGNNYAAVGDVVSMPIPMNGSGITNSVKAGRMLAETVMDIDKAGKAFNTAELWNYQVKYYQSIADKMIAVCVLKNCLLDMPEKALNYFFDNQVLTGKELGNNGSAMAMTRKEVLGKIKKGYKKPLSLLKLKSAVEKSKEAKKTAYEIPLIYDSEKVEQWRKKLNSFIE